MDKTSRIYVAGHNGMVGRAICRILEENGFNNIISASSGELDLRRQHDAEAFMGKYRPEYVFLAAARVGGILANTSQPAQFLYDNLMIQSNVIHSAYINKVKKLLFIGSACVYPAHYSRAIKEEDLLTGLPEPTNEGYAIAKIAGIKMCQYYNKQYGAPFISIMPSNLYGKYDNFQDDRSHVVSALIKRMHFAKMKNQLSATVWGTGTVMREFLYVDDLAEAALFVMLKYNGAQFLNVGMGVDTSIKELAELIKDIVGYDGKLVFDRSKPDGIVRKLLDISKISALGWSYRTPLDKGLSETYKWYLSQLQK